MNRSTKFINDIFIYAIGNLGSKLITFLLVPLYTYYISPDDFGYYDIVLTLTFLAMGFITFQLRDGTFRFLLDNEDEYTRKGVVSFSYKLMAQSSLVYIDRLSDRIVQFDFCCLVTNGNCGHILFQYIVPFGDNGYYRISGTSI